METVVMPGRPYRDGVATAIFVFVFGGLALAWAWSAGFIFGNDPYGEPAPDIVTVADATFFGEHWFSAVDSMYRDNHSLQVVTTLPDAGDASVIEANAIYDRIWSLTMRHPEWRIGMVFIFDRSGNILCGGAA